MQIRLPRSLPDELLYGRAGYLWACLFLNKHIGEGTIPSSMTVILGLFQFTILVLTLFVVSNHIAFVSSLTYLVETRCE